MLDSKNFIFLFQLVRIDTTITTDTEPQYMLDAVTGLCFSPPVIGHLIVITAQSRLLKFDAKSGQMISEVVWIGFTILYKLFTFQNTRSH